MPENQRSSSDRGRPLTVEVAVPVALGMLVLIAALGILLILRH